MPSGRELGDGRAADDHGLDLGQAVGDGGQAVAPLPFNDHHPGAGVLHDVAQDVALERRVDGDLDHAADARPEEDERVLEVVLEHHEDGFLARDAEFGQAGGDAEGGRLELGVGTRLPLRVHEQPRALDLGGAGRVSLHWISQRWIGTRATPRHGRGGSA